MKASPNTAVTTQAPGTRVSAEASARHRLPWLAPISAWLENEAILGYVLMTPALLLIVVFIAYPFSLGVWLSLTDKLVGMGAKIILCDPYRCLIQGPNRLYGENLESPDIRAGMSMLLAALAAKGQSTIRNIGQIERGYENVDGKLRALGAHIERVRE